MFKVKSCIGPSNRSSHGVPHEDRSIEGAGDVAGGRKITGGLFQPFLN